MAEGVTFWVDAYPVRAFAVLSCVYVAAVVALSSLKLLWLDELITLHIARLGSASAIWHALAEGADPNPPLTHLLVGFSRDVFGEHAFALRLPAVLGYWLGLLSLFAFLRRRVSPTWAIAGTALSMTMAAFEYSYESRSYALFYGLCMAALLCWSMAVDPATTRARQRLALVGMTAALAGGVCTNYFAVLAFVPIAAGELARTVRLAKNRQEYDPRPLAAEAVRTLDLRVWAALLVAAAPLIAFRHLIARSIAQFAPYAWNKVSLDQVFDSYTEMVEIVLYPLLALLGFAVVLLLLSRACSHCRAAVRPRWVGRLATEVRSPRPAVPGHEAAAILCLMAYPILGFVLASIHGGMLSPRFVIPVCFGFAIAGVLAARRLFVHSPTAPAVALCLFAAWFVARESVVGYWYMQQKSSFYSVVDHLAEAERGLPPNAPIVLADPLLALTFQQYAPQTVAARTVFPVDFPAVRLYRKDDSPEENLWAGRGWLYQMPVVTMAEFQKNAGRYLIIASPRNWLVEDLVHHGYRVQRLPIDTRATSIGGFTPLSRGVPSFYVAEGDAFLRTHAPEAPEPFQAAKNLPDANLTPAEGGPFEDHQ